MPDWNTGWMPPGVDPSAPTASTQDTGWDWSWLFPPSTGRAGPPGGGRYGRAIPPGGNIDFGALFTTSPEDQLTQEILDKMGGARVGVGRGSSIDAARVRAARWAAHRAMTDPAYREQLAQSLGWHLGNPHVANWVMHGGAVPADPTGSGGAPSTSTVGGKGTSAAAAPAKAASIGTPFDPSKYGGRGSDPGFLYGAVLPPEFAAAAGIDRQWGVDYALPLGTPQTSPFAGTVKESGWNGPYGNTVVVQLANGYTYRVAHLESLNVKVGDTVAVGQELGPTGSTGNSTGPHVLIEMRDPQGKPVDPTPIIDKLLAGDLTGAQSYLADYQTANTSVGPIKTEDGHLLYPGSQDYNVFFAAQSMWRKRYGGDPPWTFVSSLIAQGMTTTEQISSQMDAMSSDIPNLNWGARDALTNNVNQAAQKAWNRTVPDATIKQLAALGITDPGGINGWIQSHPAGALDPATYGQYFDAVNPKTQELWQQPPSPDLIAHIHQQMQQGPQ